MVCGSFSKGLMMMGDEPEVETVVEALEEYRVRLKFKEEIWLESRIERLRFGEYFEEKGWSLTGWRGVFSRKVCCESMGKDRDV